jgi:hypothetical protein
MDKIAKFLLKCSANQEQILLDIIKKLFNLDFIMIGYKEIKVKKRYV